MKQSHTLPEPIVFGGDCFSFVHTINSLQPVGAIWRHKAVSTLALVMVVAGRHQAVTWTNVDKFCGDMKAISQEIPMI